MLSVAGFSDCENDSPTPGGRQKDLMSVFVNLFALTIRYAVPWLSLCFALFSIGHIMTLAFDSSSAANTWIQLMSNVSRTRAFAFIFGFLGVMYGIQERNLRRSEVKRLRLRVTVLERALLGDRTCQQ